MFISMSGETQLKWTVFCPSSDFRRSLRRFEAHGLQATSIAVSQPLCLHRVQPTCYSFCSHPPQSHINHTFCVCICGLLYISHHINYSSIFTSVNHLQLINLL
ncbi:hypothetical protein AHF37_10308 [Paragonimus kellicotti]|nr:hypothetical protein AHF37_10308 [Paragonimus kellicotti]